MIPSMVKYAIMCSIKLYFLRGYGLKVDIFAPHRLFFMDVIHLRLFCAVVGSAPGNARS